MAVTAVLVVCHDHLRLGLPNDVDQATSCFVDRRIHEVVGVLVGLRVLHTRVAIAKKENVRDAEDARRLSSLFFPNLTQSGHRLLGVQVGIMHLALLASGAVHDDYASSLVRVLREQPPVLNTSSSGCAC